MVHTHARTHAHTHTRTHEHTQTDTHTHTQAFSALGQSVLKSGWVLTRGNKIR